MSLDLAFDDGQQAIADAVAHFCAETFDDDAVKASTGRLPREAWSALAALGVLGVLTEEEEGGLLEAVAAVESLGAAAFPGPLAASFLASVVLEGAEQAAVADGSAIVSVGADGLWPWGAEASVFLEVEVDGVSGEERIHRVAPQGALDPVETLGGEPWARAPAERVRTLSRGAEGLAVLRTVLAAQLAALGHRLVRDASGHAAVRKQFGRPIGDFQAVAHPLADASMRLEASSALAHAAAWAFDAGREADARRLACAAHASAAAAAKEALSVGHQVFGAVGITIEGPAFHVSRRIRQLVSQAPAPDLSAARIALAEGGV